jgi:glycosyltransferase involved in cell wall biosynthesis
LPKVSIITALHNKEPYIAETIRSVLAQTMTNWELIVVENGSADNGTKIVRQFSDSRIRLVISPKQGPGAARNFGLTQATGEWILFLDADDLVMPDYLKRVIDTGEQAKADMVVSRWRKFTNSPADLQAEEIPTCEGRSHTQLLDSAIVFAPWAVHAAVTRRRAFEREVWWAEHLDCFLGEDVAFWFQILHRTSAWVCQPEAGALYRWKTPKCRTQNEDAAKWFNGLHAAAEENLAYLARHRLKPTPGQCENMMRLYESLYLLATNTQNNDVAKESARLARLWLERSLEHAPHRKALRARQVMGFKIFNFFKKCVRFQA